MNFLTAIIRYPKKCPEEDENRLNEHRLELKRKQKR